VANASSAISGLQPSGLFIGQLDDPGTKINVNYFFGLDAAGTGSLSSALQSMTSLTGFETTSSYETFMYSARIDFKLVVPLANLTGTYYQGKMRLGQMVDSTSPTVSQGVTVNSLIRGANEVNVVASEFSLQSSIVNDVILTHSLRSGDNVTNYLTEADLGAEIIDYVVLQSPAVNITTGNNSLFTLLGKLSTNVVMMPSISDFLLYRTYPVINHHKQMKELDFNYSPVSTKVLDAVHKPHNVAEIKKFEQALERDETIFAEVEQGEPLLEEDFLEVPKKFKKGKDEDVPPKDGCIIAMSRQEAGIRMAIAMLKIPPNVLMDGEPVKPQINRTMNLVKEHSMFDHPQQVVMKKGIAKLEKALEKRKAPKRQRDMIYSGL
jgi:hypothetical protein